MNFSPIMIDELNISGLINKNSQFVTIEKKMMTEFFRTHPNYKAFVTIRAFPQKEDSAIFGHYKYIVLPFFRQKFYENGENYTDDVIEEKMREFIPFMHKLEMKEKGGFANNGLREFAELSTKEKIFFLEELKRFASENFGGFIE